MDLLIINEASFIENISVCTRIGNSDHNILFTPKLVFQLIIEKTSSKFKIAKLNSF